MSLLVHAAVAGAAWKLREACDIYLLDPQAGRASIALTASLAAQPEAMAPEAVLETPLDEAAAQADPDRERREQSKSAITRDDASHLESALRLMEPVEPMIVAVEDAVTPIVVGGPAERNKASREPPPPVAESASQNLPRRRRLETESSIPSPASVPAPSSLAMSGVDAEKPPEILLNPPPIYPPDALAAGRTGRVLVRAEIAADGNVIEARLQRSSGVASLDRAAVSAVRGWRFSSAADSTSPPRRIDVPIDFVIRR